MLHRSSLPLAALGLAASLTTARAAAEPETGGANGPEPSPPPALAVQTVELAARGFSVRVPTGTYAAPAGGAPAYGVPGPVVAFKGADGVWRGHGYLETYPRLQKLTAVAATRRSAAGVDDGAAVQLDYEFEGGRRYRATITATQARDVVLIDEESDLGPRNCWVFDAYYGGWTPGAGFALDLGAKHHAFLTMPCFYDKPEVTILPAQLQQAGAGKPAGVGVVAIDPAKRDVAAFWARDVASWRGADTMGIQLWQRRQLPGDPASRHFLGPDTKSDATPNPRTAPLMGKSLYEGHVTVELALGTGTRRLGFTVGAKPAQREQLIDGVKAVAGANQ